MLSVFYDRIEHLFTRLKCTEHNFIFGLVCNLFCIRRNLTDITESGLQ